MSEVLRRTIYIEKPEKDEGTGTPMRTADWACVTTSKGTMWEPFIPFQRRGQTDNTNMLNHDFSESMHRVDKIEFVTMNQFHKIMNSGGESNMMGGTLLPRVGA